MNQDQDRAQHKRRQALLAARLAVVQMIYASGFRGELSAQDLIDEFNNNSGKADLSLVPDEFVKDGLRDRLVADGALFRQLMRHHEAHQAELHAILDHVTEAQSENLPRGERLFETIMMVALCEMQRQPARALMLLDEYVSLTAMFYDQGLTGVANALLTRALEELTLRNGLKKSPDSD